MRSVVRNRHSRFRHIPRLAEAAAEAASRIPPYAATACSMPCVATPTMKSISSSVITYGGMK